MLLIAWMCTLTLHACLVAQVLLRNHWDDGTCNPASTQAAHLLDGGPCRRRCLGSRHCLAGTRSRCCTPAGLQPAVDPACRHTNCQVRSIVPPFKLATAAAVCTMQREAPPMIAPCRRRRLCLAKICSGKGAAVQQARALPAVDGSAAQHPALGPGSAQEHPWHKAAQSAAAGKQTLHSTVQSTGQAHAACLVLQVQLISPTRVCGCVHARARIHARPDAAAVTGSLKFFMEL